MTWLTSEDFSGYSPIVIIYWLIQDALKELGYNGGVYFSVERSSDNHSVIYTNVAREYGTELNVNSKFFALKVLSKFKMKKRPYASFKIEHDGVITFYFEEEE